MYGHVTFQASNNILHDLQTFNCQKDKNKKAIIWQIYKSTIKRWIILVFIIMFMLKFWKLNRDQFWLLVIPNGAALGIALVHIITFMEEHINKEYRQIKRVHIDGPYSLKLRRNLGIRI
jgi:hypothetical protein